MHNNEKHADRADAGDGKTNHFGAGQREMYNPRFINADNHDLWRWDKLPDGGDAPEVNGHWADEIQGFVATSGELLVLAEHWADVAICRTFMEWANAPFWVSTDHWRHVYFGWRRVYRIRALLGEVIDQLIKDRIKKFREEDGASCDPESWKEFLRLIDQEAQNRHLGPTSSGFVPPAR